VRSTSFIPGGYTPDDAKRFARHFAVLPELFELFFMVRNSVSYEMLHTQTDHIQSCLARIEEDQNA
jgi:hypothetical protein